MHIRSRGEITAADEDELLNLLKFECSTDALEVRNHKLSMSGAEEFDVTGFATIQDITVWSPNSSLIHVQLTKAGPTSFDFQTASLFMLRSGQLTGLKIINPGSGIIEVRLIVGGS